MKSTTVTQMRQEQTERQQERLEGERREGEESKVRVEEKVEASRRSARFRSWFDHKFSAFSLTAVNCFQVWGWVTGSVSFYSTSIYSAYQPFYASVLFSVYPGLRSRREVA
ncbi:hypothetical protein BDV18DRAFT_38754 [Aspergillus unguis]